MDAPLPHLLTPQDVASWLSLPTDRVVRMARRGDIPCLILPGGDMLFDQLELVGWLAGFRAAPKRSNYGDLESPRPGP